MAEHTKLQPSSWSEFWARMEKRAAIVATWPEWEKGSRVNKREAKVTAEDRARNLELSPILLGDGNAKDTAWWIGQARLVMADLLSDFEAMRSERDVYCASAEDRLRQIKGIGAERDRYKSELEAMRVELEILRDKYDRMRKVIEDAPHYEECSYRHVRKVPCDCWKSRVNLNPQPEAK